MTRAAAPPLSPRSGYHTSPSRSSSVSNDQSRANASMSCAHDWATQPEMGVADGCFRVGRQHVVRRQVHAAGKTDLAVGDQDLLMRPQV